MPDQYGPHTTADEVLAGWDLSGRRYLITGGTSGLGLETARALVAKGAAVTITARTAQGAATALAQIRGLVEAARTPVKPIDVTAVSLDLESLSSVSTAAERLCRDEAHFDGLVANAGVMACPYALTEDGFERHLQTNHLGHFLLLNRLLPCLNRTDGRVIVLTSGAHRWSDVDLDDPNFERRPYNPWIGYARSKTANALFAVELDRRLDQRGAHAWSVHPGAISTQLSRHATPEVRALSPGRGVGPVAPRKSVEAGAATTVWSLVAPELHAYGGRYLRDCQVAPISTEANLDAVRPYAQDSDHAADVWEWSEHLIEEAVHGP